MDQYICIKNVLNAIYSKTPFLFPSIKCKKTNVYVELAINGQSLRLNASRKWKRPITLQQRFK